MTLIKRIISLIIALTLAISSFGLTLEASAKPVFAVSYKTESVNERLGKVTLSDEYDMWHYSSGIWKVGNAYSSFTWTDAEIGGAANIGRQLQAKTQVTYKWTLPSEWLAQTGNGLYLQIALAPLSGGWSTWYNTSSFKQSYSKGTVTYTFSPYFKVSSLRTFDDYISGLKVTLPLIDYSRGNNLYSIFSASSGLGRSEGRYFDSGAYSYSPGYMHPLMIKNYTGKLKNGYIINTESGNVSTDNLSVGTNTLVNGGALGLLFKFPLVATVDLKGTRTVPVYTAEEQAAQEAKKQEEERLRKEEEERKQLEEEMKALEAARIHRLK